MRILPELYLQPEIKHEATQITVSNFDLCKFSLAFLAGTQKFKMFTVYLVCWHLNSHNFLSKLFVGSTRPCQSDVADICGWTSPWENRVWKHVFQQAFWPKFDFDFYGRHQRRNWLEADAARSRRYILYYKSLFVSSSHLQWVTEAGNEFLRPTQDNSHCHGR